MFPRHDAEGRIRLQRRVFAAMESWLDRVDHVAHLRQPAVAGMIMDAIAFRQGRVWDMIEYVVMPHTRIYSLNWPVKG